MQKKRKIRKRGIVFFLCFVFFMVITHKMVSINLAYTEKTQEKTIKVEKMYDDLPKKEIAIQNKKEVVKETKGKEQKVQIKKEQERKQVKKDEKISKSKKFPLPDSHRRYLYKISKKYGIKYQVALAIMKHESNFNSKAVSKTNDYGYFQINKVNHERLSKALKTQNKPLDPYVNMKWGVYMLKESYEYWEKKGLSGKKLDYYAWSSYNKGINGVKKTGLANHYVKGVEKSLKEIQQFV